MNITQIAVSKVKPTDKTQQLYYDDQLKGFGLRVTKNGVKAYFIEKKIDKKLKRITIGRANEIDANQARQEAKKLLGKIALGISIIEESTNNDSLKKIYELYLSSRKNLSQLSVYQYNRLINIQFKEWEHLPITNITNRMISEKHIQIGQTYNPSTANVAMRLLKSIFNFYIAVNEDIKINNPVNVLTRTKSWYKLDVRKTYIKKDQLSDWYMSVKECNDTLRDYLIFVLCTGLRKMEAATLTWDQVNFKTMTFIINDTKNGLSHELPLTKYLYSMLMLRDKSQKYVFPGAGHAGHIIDGRHAIHRVIEKSGVQFTIHDLRRTFATVADSLDIPAYALKRLLNHKSSNDVTEGYIGVDVERLRNPMELISEFFQEQFGENN